MLSAAANGQPSLNDNSMHAFVMFEPQGYSTYSSLLADSCQWCDEEDHGTDDLAR